MGEIIQAENLGLVPLGQGGPAAERGDFSIGGRIPINPSGGPLAANPIMATGLIRVIEAARAIKDGRAQRSVGHSSSGPCLQQNMVCVLEGN